MASNSQGTGSEAPLPPRKCWCDGTNEHCSFCDGTGMREPWRVHEIPERPAYKARPVTPTATPPASQQRRPSPPHLGAPIPLNQVSFYSVRVRNVPARLDPQSLRTRFEKVGPVVSVTMHVIQGERPTASATVVMASPELACTAAKQLNRHVIDGRRISTLLLSLPRFRSIVIQNLPRKSTTNERVWQLLRKFGRIYFLKTNKRTRSAIAKMSTNRALAAANALNGALYCGRQLSAHLLPESDGTRAQGHTKKRHQPKLTTQTSMPRDYGAADAVDQRNAATEVLDAKRHWNAFSDPSGGFGSYPSHDDYGEEGSA